MAAANRPGGFVLEVAELGKEVLSTFTQFVLSRKVHDHRLETLLATISITTSLLVELGSTINKYENDYHVKEEIFRPTCETCKADFDKLLEISRIAKERGGWITEDPIGGQSIATEVDSWFVLNVSLGHSEKANQFWSRLHITRQRIDALNCTVRFKIFKELSRQNRLEQAEERELKHLTTLVPGMVYGLERIEKERKERLGVKEEKEKKEKAPKTVKSSRKRPDVGEKDDFAEFIEKAEADASSEDTVIEADGDVKGQKKEKKRVKFAELDDDSSSVSSFSSFEPYEKHFHESTKVIYEEWQLSFHSQRSVTRRSWGLLGLKIKKYDEETEYWDINPELRSQSELKAAHVNAASSMTESKYRSSIDKAIKAFPEEARDLIDWLIEDRSEATNNERFMRQWSVVAVRPKAKHVYHEGRKLVKSVKGNDWLIMIKGETLGKIERRRPDRWEDPWRKPNPRRNYPRHYDRYEDREYYRHRPHYAEYDDYVPQPPVRVAAEPRVEDPPVDDGFRSGLVNVGMFLSQEDAEARMDKILDDMTGKLEL